MKINNYSRKSFNYFSDVQIKLAEDQESLRDYIGLPFSVESIKKQIELKKPSFSQEKRNNLQSHFEIQYKNVELSDSIQRNIALLGNEKSFTITTGQQLTLLGGPAFFFYKIIHCIATTNELNKIYPEYHFIPVFWLASEDHDKEEISETTLFNQLFRWENDFKGPTGEFPLDENFLNIKNSILDFFSDNEINEHIKNFQGINLSQGFVHFLTSIFKDYGLLVLDANSQLLKRELTPIFENEITQFSTFKNISETDSLLIKQGIKPQAKIQEINFFKLENNKRSKINFSENKYFISNKEISREQLLMDIKNQPESFSPNVFLRPLYQELILPNLAYIGGPGELSYWLQLKANFEHYSIPYPILINRLSLFIIDSSTQKKMSNFSFSFLQYINSSFDDLKKEYLAKTKDFETLNWDDIDSQLSNSYMNFKKIYQNATPEIQGFLESEWKNIDKSIEKIKTKLQKQLASKHEVGIKQIEQIRNKLFPKSIPQERIYHFFTFCPNGSLDSMRELINEIDPFSTDILVVSN